MVIEPDNPNPVSIFFDVGKKEINKKGYQYRITIRYIFSPPFSPLKQRKAKEREKNPKKLQAIKGKTPKAQVRM